MVKKEKKTSVPKKKTSGRSRSWAEALKEGQLIKNVGRKKALVGLYFREVHVGWLEAKINRNDYLDFERVWPLEVDFDKILGTPEECRFNGGCKEWDNFDDCHNSLAPETKDELRPAFLAILKKVSPKVKKQLCPTFQDLLKQVKKGG